MRYSIDRIAEVGAKYLEKKAEYEALMAQKKALDTQIELVEYAMNEYRSELQTKVEGE